MRYINRHYLSIIYLSVRGSVLRAEEVMHVSGVMADVLFYAASDYLHIFLT